MRIDKWLWAARFFKTRSLAQQAVEGGRVRLNDSGIKPAHEVKIGDRLDIASGEQRWQIAVRGLNAQRRPADEARQLYEESDESRERRVQQAEMKKLAPSPEAERHGRPSKRDRRQIHRFRDGY